MALLETNKENTEKNVMLCGRIAEDAVAATEGGTEEKTAEEVSQLVIYLLIYLFLFEMFTTR